MHRLQQMNLDSIVSRTPKQPPFCVAGLLDYIVGLIVREDEVSKILFAFLRRSPLLMVHRLSV